MAPRPRRCAGGIPFRGETRNRLVPIADRCHGDIPRTTPGNPNLNPCLDRPLQDQPQSGRNHAHRSDAVIPLHLHLRDRHGNAVATTYTLNLNFGSGIVAAGTGILLNHEMDDFSVKPGVPNAFGLVGGEANAVAPGKRPLSSMSPTIVLRDGKPWLVTGSPGGSRIITTTLQTLVNTIDYGMNPAAAAATPRIHHQWVPDQLRVETGFSPDTLKLLRDQGYQVTVGATMGRTQTIQVRDGGLYGYSDPRNPDGATLGH